MLNTAAIGVVIGPCAGSTEPYGPDGEFCTADDPLSAQGVPATLPLTTGLADGVVLNANNSPGQSVGPFSLAGSPFNCDLLANGNAGGSVVGAFPACDQPTIGDVVMISSFSMMDFVSPTPTLLPPNPIQLTEPDLLYNLIKGVFVVIAAFALVGLFFALRRFFQK
jgi:hypothetical protein